MKKKGGGIGFGNVPKPNAENIVISEVEHQDEYEPWVEQESRIAALLGDPDECPFNEAISKFYDYLCSSLELPFDVTGIEDFRWEERYVFGPPKPGEYARLRKKQPSFQDTFELLSIEQGAMSEWMLFAGEDLAAHVRRKSDGKEFCLGLAELEVTNKKSKNHQLLDDYVVYFANYR
ncbi:MAG: hypothetical protein AAFR30_10185 [Cyanobacteria bacterium J06628_4]